MEGIIPIVIDTSAILQHVLTRRRGEINMQCDMLLAEIENKRSYFLADLDYEERIHQNSMEDCIKRLEKVLGASQGLQSYVQDVLGSEKAPFLEVNGLSMSAFPKYEMACSRIFIPLLCRNKDKDEKGIVRCVSTTEILYFNYK